MNRHHFCDLLWYQGLTQAEAARGNPHLHHAKAAARVRSGMQNCAFRIPHWYNGRMATPAYDPRYLAGIVLFNRRDFFEAHEVWENLWLSPEVGEDRRFVQGLIQVAVGLYHFDTGNLRGARKLYGTARAYMEVYHSPYLGLDHRRFWDEMARCFADVLTSDAVAGIAPDPGLIPTITLDPPPAAWPDPEAFLGEEH